MSWLLWASWLHAVLLVGFGIRFLLGEQAAWVTAVWCLPLAAAVPFLGRAAYKGNSFSAFVLVLAVVVPLVVAFFTGGDMVFPMAGMVFLPVYLLGVKGATGLRGRRASARRRASGR